MSAPETIYEKRFAAARVCLLVVALGSALNVLLQTLNPMLYFPFSASVPRFFMIVAMEEKRDPEDLLIFAVFALISAGFYLLCRLLCKRRSGWMTAAAVLFGLETFWSMMLCMFDESTFLELVFHAVILFYLARGASAAKRMKYPVFETPETVYTPPATVYPVQKKPRTIRLNGEEVKMSGKSVRAKNSARMLLNGEPVDE